VFNLWRAVSGLDLAEGVTPEQDDARHKCRTQKKDRYWLRDGGSLAIGRLKTEGPRIVQIKTDDLSAVIDSVGVGSVVRTRQTVAIAQAVLVVWPADAPAAGGRHRR